MTTRTVAAVTVAGASFTIEQAVDRFVAYPRRTPARFDYPPRGEYGSITPEDIRRTRYISSRISHAQGDYFIAQAAGAPWIDAASDLAAADPNIRGGLFDAMSELYWHFAGPPRRASDLPKSPRFCI